MTKTILTTAMYWPYCFWGQVYGSQFQLHSFAQEWMLKVATIVILGSGSSINPGGRNRLSRKPQHLTGEEDLPTPHRLDDLQGTKGPKTHIVLESVILLPRPET